MSYCLACKKTIAINISKTLILLRKISRLRLISSKIFKCQFFILMIIAPLAFKRPAWIPTCLFPLFYGSWIPTYVCSHHIKFSIFGQNCWPYKGNNRAGYHWIKSVENRKVRIGGICSIEKRPKHPQEYST